MTGAQPTVVALAAHTRNVPMATRSALDAALGQLDLPLVLVRTCHRIDAFAAPNPPDIAAAVAALAAVAPDGARLLVAEDAIRHAIAVASGRDSVVPGEDQILHQVRVALDDARAAGRLSPVLERLFASALRAGRRSRSWLPGRPRSLADEALDAIRDASGRDLQGQDVLVVGAGAIGTLAARAARHAGANVVVANRTPERAAALAGSVDGGVAPLDPGVDIAAPDIVVVAIHGRWSVADATAAHLVRSGTWVADLSVPPAVDPALAVDLGDRYVDADRLAATAGARAGDAAWARRVDRLVDETTAEMVDWLTRSSGRAAARALIERAERERRAELDLLYRRRPALDAADREAIEHMTRHLADRLLQAPLERLGRDAEGDAGRAVRDLFAL